jgi:hypothetical protein
MLRLYLYSAQRNAVDELGAFAATPNTLNSIFCSKKTSSNYTTIKGSSTNGIRIY